MGAPYIEKGAVEIVKSVWVPKNNRRKSKAKAELLNVSGIALGNSTKFGRRNRRSGVLDNHKTGVGEVRPQY